MPYVNFNYLFILAASLSAIVCTANPVWAHAPEYHVPSEPEQASPPATAKPTSEPTPNFSEQETSIETSTFRLPPPKTGECLLGLLAIGPFMMVAIKQRWQHHHK